MTAFIGSAGASDLCDEAAALALLATQHLGAAAFLAHRLEVASFMACQQVVDQMVKADSRIASGEVISEALEACLDAMHQARDLREELDESLSSVLPWCGSVQVRSAVLGRIKAGSEVQ